MQVWKKFSTILAPQKSLLSSSHCMIPTPVKLKKNLYRVFYGSRNKKGISRIFFSDILIKKESFVIKRIKAEPSLTNGKLGAFDDNGVLPSSIIKIGKKLYLFYIGWRPGGTTRFSLIAGLAISNNQGKKFKRYSNAPILKTNNDEPISILTAPMVLKIKKNLFYMWYVSGIEWKNKDYPKYNIKLATSYNLKKWTQTGTICIKLRKGERAIARPFVVVEKNKFKMWYCFEKKVGKYKIGYAESRDGRKWIRKDSVLKFIGHKSKYDKDMMAYPSVIDLNKNKRVMMYNGNNYGKYGVHFAELIDKL